jgi:hypothetical protein
MLDFVYEKPDVDYCFCLENQFEVFRRNDTFKTTLQKMEVEIPGNSTSCLLIDFSLNRAKK